MSDCRFGVSPVNYPDPDPDPDLPAQLYISSNTTVSSSRELISYSETKN